MYTNAQEKEKDANAGKIKKKNKIKGGSRKKTSERDTELLVAGPREISERMDV